MMIEYQTDLMRSDRGYEDLKNWLRNRYRVLTGMLEDKADPKTWPIIRDHCFQRVALDVYFGDVWYAHVDSRPAYKSISNEELSGVCDLLSCMLREGEETVHRLNALSLYYRGKLDKDSRYETPDSWSQR